MLNRPSNETFLALATPQQQQIDAVISFLTESDSQHLGDSVHTIYGAGPNRFQHARVYPGMVRA